MRTSCAVLSCALLARAVRDATSFAHHRHRRPRVRLVDYDNNPATTTTTKTKTTTTTNDFSSTFAVVGRRRSLATTTTATSVSQTSGDDDGESATAATTTTTTATTTKEEEGEKECWYQYKEGKWRKRIKLEDLKKGQMLKGFKLKQDLLNGKTGPKVFFECGVGRLDSRNRWHIVNGMLRLGRRGSTKASVVRKRVARLNKMDEVDLYVSEIRSDHGALEVALRAPDDDDASATKTRASARTPASDLVPGQELAGTVVRVENYGAFVDVGASRNGLLHVTTARERRGAYVDGAEGLAALGFGRGAEVLVRVASNERKRIALDYAEEDAAAARRESDERRTEKRRRREAFAALRPGVGRVGTVVSVHDFGVFVDVDASENGLLHVSKVGNLYDSYIAGGAKGLARAGLEKGAKIRVVVDSVDGRRLLLDFTDEDKAAAEQGRSNEEETVVVDEDDSTMDEDELAAWAEFAAVPTPSNTAASAAADDDDDLRAWAEFAATDPSSSGGTDDDEDDYDVDNNDEDDLAAWAEFAAAPDHNDDEDRDIEDSLGLGSY